MVTRNLFILISLVISLQLISCKSPEKKISEKIITFESDIMPGEMDNRILVDSITNLYEKPFRDADVMCQLKKWDYVGEYPIKVCYRTIKESLFKTLEAIPFKGKNLGDVTFISDDSLRKVSDHEYIFLYPGDTLRELQEVGEGFGFYKIRSRVFYGEPLNNDYMLLKEGITELWVKVKTLDNKEGWLLVDNKAVKQFYDPEYIDYVSKDITKKAKDIFSMSGADYYLRVIKCTIDKFNYKTITITAAYNYDHDMALTLVGLSPERKVAYHTILPLFQVVTRLYNSYPEADNINMRIIDNQKERDRYGNLVDEGEKELCRTYISRNTCAKINWNYANKNIRYELAFGDMKIFFDMLDSIRYTKQ
jgi:hypothetical protein